MKTITIPNIDLDLLHEQRMILNLVIETLPKDSSYYESLLGIQNLLDEMQNIGDAQ